MIGILLIFHGGSVYIYSVKIGLFLGLWDNFEARGAQGFDLPKGVNQDTVQQVVEIGIFLVLL